jgi:hypothetical protein
MRPGSVFSALECDGLASDVAIAGLTAVVGYRLHIAAGERHHQCVNQTCVALVALAPTEPALPESTRAVLRELTPGNAVAASGLRELVGGWVAMPGRDVRIATCGDLGADNVVAITLDDAAGFLSAAGGDRLLVRTTVVLAGALPAAREEPAAALVWRVVADGLPAVPLRPASHDHAALAAS